ncbi:hypothetical protein O181_065427 [Austropuccinia psidii MF-1]|uniref:DASH complex subunit DUO1 n=1 Tax=Austropuccinia psidii MF-1 TaxID=1389203 RepID=A0A9Q3ETG3_9BASI|nr:hypothetical protein [Austropuccinia psidii MF-1]
MPPQGRPPSTSGLVYDADILNDSISIDLDDDSFDGNQSTLAPPTAVHERFLRDPPSSASTHKRGSPRHSTQANSADMRSSPPISTDREQSQPNSPPDTIRRRKSPGHSDDRWTRETSRNEELERERDWLREMNDLLENAADDMNKMKEKIQSVEVATQASHELLDLYSKIMTQTEKTRDLLLNPVWQGYSADVQRRTEAKRQEQIRLAKEQEKEREEQLLREQQQQAEAEVERLRKSQLPKPTRGRTTRGRATTTTRTNRGKSRVGRIT